MRKTSGKDFQKHRKKKKKTYIAFFVFCICFIARLLTGRPDETVNPAPENPASESSAEIEVQVSSVPEYSGKSYIFLEENKPNFTKSDMTEEAFETYSELDSLGRCGAAFSCIGQELMPDEERGNIGHIKPSGWHTVKYDTVEGKYLYNRCHLIGYQLTAENSNKRNLITGTRYMNQNMIPFENKTADYINETGNHVLYRVTPVFEGDNLLAEGVRMEAYSVEDDGEGVCFHVFVYNVQPGITLDYATGKSRLE